ncbi:MAG: MopE-related protein [Myxococcota bacterium]|nr:MopE-related protein [Myxococcota bacterium]
MRARLSLFVGVLGAFGVGSLGLGCAADRSGLAIGDGGGFDGQFDGGFSCPEGTFDLDGDGRCECTFSSDVESCDGIDNDCDLSTPDGSSDPIVGTACDGDDADRCEDGAYVCAEAGFSCEEPTDNDDEICDEFEQDDDCDGVIDEGCACTGDDTRSCGTDVGECTRGLQRCVAGVFSACDGVGPSDDVCNALDDDCDGRTDEALDAACWVDGDSDTYAAAGAASTCAPVGGCPGGFTARRPGSGEQDCNDGAGGINPGATEACDLVDQDCDGRIDEGITFGCWVDGDRDGYPANGAAGRCMPSGGCPAGTTMLNPAMAANRDCNDSNPAVRPMAMEVCNGVDDNCNGVVDDTLPNGCWNDGDGDGYAPMGAAGRCQPSSGMCPVGTTPREPSGATNIDCNDGNAMVRPGLPEVCNGIDDNCAGGVDDGLAFACWADGDRDGFAPNGAAGQCRPTSGCPTGTTATNPTSAATRDCNDGNASIRPGGTETCNNVDEDCDTTIDEGVTRACTTACGMGTETCSAGSFAGCTAPMPMTEVCNGADDDCNGTPDNGLPDGCWADPDGDGYPAAGAAGQCAPSGGCPANTTNRDPATAANRDCAEGNANVNPGEDEVCNGVDDDCDGSIEDECGADCRGAVSGGRFYVFCNRTNRDYGEGSSDCGGIGTMAGSSGMDLVSINSSTEQTFVQTAALAISMNEWWIGLYRTGGMMPMWTWEDGSSAPQTSAAAPPPYNNWAVVEPDGSGACARMLTTGQWGDRNCNDNLRYVCEGPIP